MRLQLLGVLVLSSDFLSAPGEVLLLEWTESRTCAREGQQYCVRFTAGKTQAQLPLSGMGCPRRRSVWASAKLQRAERAPAHWSADERARADNEPADVKTIPASHPLECALK